MSFIDTLHSSVTFNIGINPCNEQSDQSTEHYNHPGKFPHPLKTLSVIIQKFWFSSYPQFTSSSMWTAVTCFKITGLLNAVHCFLLSKNNFPVSSCPVKWKAVLILWISKEIRGTQLQRTYFFGDIYIIEKI